MSQIDVLMLVEPDSLLLDLAGPAEALRLANQVLQGRGAAPAFRLRFIAARPEAQSSVGLQLAALEPLPDALPAQAWLILVGCRSRQGDEARPDSAQLAASLRTERWLAKQGAQLLAQGGRVLSICSGALLAARAGLLSGRRCTTHHELLDDLRRQPGTEVLDNRVFVVDGPVSSSAGITAGIDLCLHHVAQHCGDDVAAAVAQTMVVYLRRSPQDPQLSPMLAHRHHLHPALHRAQDAICADPQADWNLQRLAKLAHVTPRHLSRLFASHAGTTVLHYVQAIRLERARKALAAGASLGQAAEQAGFSSAQQLRRARRALES